MAPLIDIIGSFILGGMILVMTTKLNFIISDNSQQANMSLTAQTNCVVVTKILENDFANLGINCGTKVPLQITDSTKVKMYTDIGGNGSPDSITFFAGPMTAPFSSANPRHLLLYRMTNTIPTIMNVGCTNIKFLYFDSAGVKTLLPSKVRAVRVALDFESILPNIDTVYTVIHWQQYFIPKTLRYQFN